MYTCIICLYSCPQLSDYYHRIPFCSAAREHKYSTSTQEILSSRLKGLTFEHCDCFFLFSQYVLSDYCTKGVRGTTVHTHTVLLESTRAQKLSCILCLLELSRYLTLLS